MIGEINDNKLADISDSSAPKQGANGVAGGQEAGPENKQQAAEAMFRRFYDELRGLAQQRLSREPQDALLQRTALVHEVWLRIGQGVSKFENATHFIAAAALTMRHILIDWARRKAALRHGAGQEHVDLETVEIAITQPGSELAALGEALAKLAAEAPLKAEVVRLRYLAGMTIEEVARHLGISEPTAKRYWASAREWLRREINGTPQDTQ